MGKFVVNRLNPIFAYYCIKSIIVSGSVDLWQKVIFSFGKDHSEVELKRREFAFYFYKPRPYNDFWMKNLKLHRGDFKRTGEIAKI